MNAKVKLFNFFLLVSISLLLACVDFDPKTLDNLHGKTVYKIGHGGTGFRRWFPFQPLPANSSASIKSALEQGADGVEVDLQMTNDGKFVLYHDNQLQSLTAKSGCIADYGFSEVVGTNYQVGWPFDWFQNEQIISLDSLVQLLKDQGIFPLLHLDMRTYSACLELQPNQLFERRFIQRLDAELRRLGVPKEKVLLISVTKDALLKAQEINCRFPLSLEVIQEFEADLEWALKHEIKVLTVKPRILDLDKVRLAHEKGIEVITFGAKSKSGNAKLLRLNPDYIQTDNLKALTKLLEN